MGTGGYRRKNSSMQAVKYSSCWTETMLISCSDLKVVRMRSVRVWRTWGVRRRLKVMPDRKVAAGEG